MGRLAILHPIVTESPGNSHWAYSYNYFLNLASSINTTTKKPGYTTGFSYTTSLSLIPDSAIAGHSQVLRPPSFTKEDNITDSRSS